jgi:hypothetical protein
VNYSTESQIKAPGVEKVMYLDVANFDLYHMIIGTLFMQQNKVWLDLESNRVIVNGIATPATPVDECNINKQIRHHRTTDKHKN